jgi:hypothetical protein
MNRRSRPGNSQPAAIATATKIELSNIRED